MTVSINLSQEIPAMDVLIVLKSSLEHCHKHVRLLQRTRLTSGQIAQQCQFNFTSSEVTKSQRNRRQQRRLQIFQKKIYIQSLEDNIKLWIYQFKSY